MSFLVQSFDFGGSSSVHLHIITSNLSSAMEVYENVASSCDEYNKKHSSSGLQKIVDLVYAKSDTPCLDGFPIFFTNSNDMKKRAFAYDPMGPRRATFAYMNIASNNGRYT